MHMATPRTSLDTHRLQGTRPHYDIGDAAAKFDAGRPATVPSHLTGTARSAWKRVHKILEERQMLTPGDGAALELFASVYQRWLAAKIEVGEKLLVESVFTDKNGVDHIIQKLNPLLALISTCEVRLLAAIRELGLSPSSRDKAKLTKSDKVPTGESMAERHPELFGLAPFAEKTPTPFVIPALEMRTNDEDENE
jgi:P27 family predicted phage terminase small subunit